MLTIEFMTRDENGEVVTIKERHGQHFVPLVGHLVAFHSPDRFYTVKDVRWFYEDDVYKKPIVDVELVPYIPPTEAI